MNLQNRFRQLTRRIRHDVSYLIIRMLVFCTAALPRWAGLVLFGFIGRTVAFFAVSDRNIASNNLTSIYGKEWSPAKIRAYSWRIFTEIGKNTFDAFYLSRRRDKLVRCTRHDSLDEVQKAYDEGRGIIAITAHVGCFEMLLHFMATKGFKAFAIGRRLFDPRVDEIFRRLRSGENVEYLDRDGSMRTLIELLRKGRVMGALIDQDTSVDGVFAHFLGKLAHTPSGPMRLAMRFDIPVFVITTARQPDDTHYVYISKRLILENTGDVRRDLACNIEKANSLISEAIMRNPAQWVWMHRRWRKRPDTTDMKDIANVTNYE